MYEFHLVLVVSGLAAAGGAAGRVAAGPDAAPLPMLLLPPPPRFMFSSSSSVRALFNKILKKRANRLQTTTIKQLSYIKEKCYHCGQHLLILAIEDQSVKLTTKA